MSKQNKKIIKHPETKSVANKETIEEKKYMALGLSEESFSPERLLDKFNKELLPKFTSGNKALRESVGTDFRKQLGKIAIAFELETHYVLGNAGGERYGTLTVEFCKQIITEYNCKTPSEIALAEIVAGSYTRHLRCTEILNQILEYPSKHNEIAVISKELDRSQRTYITALTTLKQIKNPPVDLKIKATAAYFAQNQQFNTAQSIKENENIKPK